MPLVSQETITSIGLRKICFEIPRIFVLENVICISVGKKLVTKLQYFDIYLNDKKYKNMLYFW